MPGIIREPGILRFTRLPWYKRLWLVCWPPAKRRNRERLAAGLLLLVAVKDPSVTVIVE